MLDLKRLNLLIKSLKAEGYVVHNIDYCGQGEPLDHPLFSEIVGIVRSAYPLAKQRLITNGNHSYGAKLADAFLEEVMVSIDGATQESYEKYRIGGNLDQALTFLQASVEAHPDRKTIWKYILFEHNDTVTEIQLAERIAEQIGVHKLEFVRTHSAGKSLTWERTLLPLTWERSFDSATPHIEKEAIAASLRLQEETRREWR